MHERAELGGDRLDGRLVVHPAGELDPVAAHVHHDAAAGPLRSQNQSECGTEVLLAVLDQEDLAQRSLVDEFLGPHVLRREADLLRVHELHPGGGARGDHLVGLGERSRERFLADDVLAGLAAAATTMSRCS